jgi:hypothetical protein
VLKDGSEQGVDGPSLPRNNGAHLVVRSVISHLGTLLLVFRVVVDFFNEESGVLFQKTISRRLGLQAFEDYSWFLGISDLNCIL